MTPPPLFLANDWPRLRHVPAMLLTLLLLLAWLAALLVAWFHWTRRSDLESAVLVVLGGGVLAMLVGFVRSVMRHRRRYSVLAERGVWWPASVTDIARGFDPTGIEVGVPYRWIVTATAPDAGGTAQIFRSAPIRRRRDVRDLMGRQIWVRVDPQDPTCHVLLPLKPV